MRARSTLTVRCVGPGPVRARWYRSLAHALAATACGEALFESTRTDPVPWVTVRPGSLIATLSGSLGGGRIVVAPGGVAPVRSPPRAWAEAIRVLTATFPRLSGTVDRSEVGRTLVTAGSSGSFSEWVGIQTFWARGPRGDLWIARRFRLACPTPSELEVRMDRVGSVLAEEWSELTGGGGVSVPSPPGARRDWRRGSVRAIPRDGWANPAGDRAATAEVRSIRSVPPILGADGHGVVFGSSGAGKTSLLAEIAAREIRSGGTMVAIDLHGDLGPEVLGRLGEPERARLIVVDATEPPVPGIAALPIGLGEGNTAAAHLVASLKRLSPDGQDLYWGFRLERLYDSFVRLAQESGGTLLDVYDLLTDPMRRDAARLATSRPDLARFLDELAPIVRRQPDFLWSAASRLAKIALLPNLAELLAPTDGGIPVEDLLDARRSIVVRLPFGVLGSEAATFAGSLVLGRIYLGLASRRRARGDSPRIVLVLDEAHAFSPRLVVEVLTESRKFGVRIVLATQYPDRLAPEVRSAVAGSPTEFVALRVPPVSAGMVGEWVGLSREEAERWLPGLPAGHGFRLEPETGTPSSFALSGGECPATPSVWTESVERTREEFPPPVRPSENEPGDGGASERLLLAVLAAEEEGRRIDPSQAIVAALTLPGPPLIAEKLGDRWSDLVRQRLVLVGDDDCRLTEAGARRLGLTVPTGATREGGEHRALLLATFRLFARRGYRIEIVRQGRFDTTLPDARFRQIAGRPGLTPAELAEEIDRVRSGWAWRFFRGRDVHIEAEVSGALRAERIRRGWRKAAEHGAFALFVVGDAARARRVRAALRKLGLGPDRAQIWTLRLPLGSRALTPVRTG